MIRKTLPPPCPYGMAHKAKRILAGLGILASTDCTGATLTEPLSPTQQCQRDVALEALAGDLPGALDVLTGKRALRDVLIERGMSDLDADGAVDRFLSCEPVKAPAPLPGDKVI